MAQLAIKGHATRGKEVIENLGILGGENGYKLSGTNEECAYYEKNGRIYNTAPVGLNNFKIFTLEEFLEKFPYKVGDRVIDKIDGCIGIVTEMCWEEHTSCVKYCVTFGGGVDFGWYSAQSLQPYKEEKTFGECVEEAIHECLFGKEETMERKYNVEEYLKVWEETEKGLEVVVNDKFELKEDNGKFYIIKKQPQYPKTYEECCELLFPNSIALGKVLTSGYNCELLEKFGKLLICRDAYWKIVGEEMGLGEPWKPDWESFDLKYVIKTMEDEICKSTECTINCFLAFPTEEMRDAFKENFDKDLEFCKELL